jgi:hypothetical protein
MRGHVLIGLLLAAACSQDYVHILVESASNQLTLAPVTVDAEAYGGGERSDLSYQTIFTIPADGEGPLPYTDFNIAFDSGGGEVDLRVSVADTPTLWNGDVRLNLPGDGRSISLLLYAGETPVASTRFLDGDIHSLALFSRGLALAWPDPAGVALRIERDADNPGARPQLVVPDSGASQVRIMSRPGKSADGPDLFALTWVGSDDRAHLLTQQETTMFDPEDIGPATDVHVACAPQDADFDLAAVVLDGSDATMILRDETGAGSRGAFPVGTSVRNVRGLAVTADSSIVVALEEGNRWMLKRFDQLGDLHAEADLNGEVAAMTLTADGVLVLSAVRAGESLEIQAHYVADLTSFRDPAPVVTADRLPEGLFSRVALSDCAVAWPELRQDASGVVDLRVLDLDSEGNPSGASRFLNAVTDGYHFAPTAACFSPTRAYASFISITDTAALSGGVRIRQIPPAPTALE